MDEPASDQLFGKKLVRRLVLPLLLAVLAYAALLLYGDAAEVLAAAERVPLLTVLAGVALSLASFGLRAVRWQFYLRLSAIVVPLGSSLVIFLSGLAMSITPGKVGEILKALLLKERWDVPVAKSAPLVIAERLMDLVALVVLGAAGFLWPRNQALAVVVVAASTLPFLALGNSRRLGVALIELVTRVPSIARYRSKLEEAHAALCNVYTLGPFVLALFLSISAWAMQAAILVVFSAAMLPLALPITDALVAYSAPLLAGTLALLPGGLVLTEASMAGALQGLSGVSATGAATLTILVRGVTFWLAIGVGFAALLAWRSPRTAAERSSAASRSGRISPGE